MRLLAVQHPIPGPLQYAGPIQVYSPMEPDPFWLRVPAIHTRRLPVPPLAHSFVYRGYVQQQVYRGFLGNAEEFPVSGCEPGFD